MGDGRGESALQGTWEARRGESLTKGGGSGREVGKGGWEGCPEESGPRQAWNSLRVGLADSGYLLATLGG